MNTKRLFYYLLLNIVVSAATTLIVLNIWDRTHSSERSSITPVSLLPTALASAIPQTATPLPAPTMALMPYEVGAGETLGEIALQFDTSVDALMRINALQNADDLSTGMVLFVPDPNQNLGMGRAQIPENSGYPVASLTPPARENARLEIVAVIGAGDLETEHLQIRGLRAEALSLDGWRLETNDGLIYLFPNITLFQEGAVALYSKTGIDSVVALYWGRPNPTWRTGDQAIIFDADGNVQNIFNIP